jgi:DNA-binding LytR/AlgR family response regulator
MVIFLEVSITRPVGADEYQISIKCKAIPPELINVLNSIQVTQSEKYLIGYVDSNMHRIDPKDVFYIESVDKKVFLYREQEVFSSKQKLYELEESLKHYDFLRISKTTIINLSKVKTITPILSGRFEATLINNEKVIISRQYASILKKHLGL